MQTNDLLLRLFNFLKKNAVRDGHLRLSYVFLCFGVGGGVVLMDLHKWYTGWVYIIGLVVAAFGGYKVSDYIFQRWKCSLTPFLCHKHIN